ncbi:MAG: gliding motility-associated C-terminal domain-containing protein, partial [Sphingobacteriales bacterium]
DSHYDYADVDSFLIDEEPDVENTSGIITEMNEWTKISGCFRAKGGEYKIIIGNFRKDSQTDTAQLPGAFGEETYKSGMSYFLFDDILVKEIPEAYILPADTVVCRDSFYVLSAYPENARSYTWNTSAATQSITTNKYGNFTVTIVTNEGCVQEASVTVHTKFCGPVCPPLYMPNAFSPNNDGLNDYFAPANAIDMREVDFSIYNRYGQRVYSGHSLKSSWDGRYGDKLCDAGTYFYYSRYTDCHGVDFTLKGDVALIR